MYRQMQEKKTGKNTLAKVSPLEFLAQILHTDFPHQRGFFCFPSDGGLIPQKPADIYIK